jgi:hypothetical protein
MLKIHTRASIPGKEVIYDRYKLLLMGHLSKGVIAKKLMF